MASSQYSNPLSAISYSNKDFRAIFQELLDLTKKLTYKWDPSISNESDPGVILLKLNAVIGDKNNYNIDKTFSKHSLKLLRRIFLLVVCINNYHTKCHGIILPLQQ